MEDSVARFSGFFQILLTQDTHTVFARWRIQVEYWTQRTFAQNTTDGSRWIVQVLPTNTAPNQFDAPRTT